MSAIDLLDAAQEIQDFCDRQEWQSCFIGGIAVLRWSQSRVTRDVDLTLLTGFGEEELFLKTILEHFRSRVPDALSFALRSRVVLLYSSSGIGIDISLGALPYEHRMVDRATLYEFAPGVALRTCSAEDLLVLKLFASRPIDIRDAEGIAIRNEKSLDWGYVEMNLQPLAEAKDDPQIMLQLARLRKLSESL
ncbi:MAG: nucleotidyl transferase AbiEii/AbiGii toxin family protein [Bryobacteraceae bacterium]